LTLRRTAASFVGRECHRRCRRHSHPHVEVVVPRIKSAEKRMRQSKTHAAQNRAQRSQLRNAIKKVRSATGEAAAAAYKEAVTLLDRAGRKNIVHRNAAARTKARLARLVSGRPS
jgi:small subunit ribosomal protein S20